MCGWQVKLCDPLVTQAPYLNASAMVLPIIRRYTNNQIAFTLNQISIVFIADVADSVDSLAALSSLRLVTQCVDCHYNEYIGLIISMAH